MKSVAPDPLSAEDADPRRAAILTAATEVFARYGFKRTSMEDMASAAGLSRTALYQYYRSKQDIFRSLVGWYFGQVVTRVETALEPGLPPERALAAAFAAKLGPEMRLLLDSPHGEELMDGGFDAASDLVAEGERRVAALLEQWLLNEAGAGRITLPDDDAAALAAMMVAALHGLKMTPGIGYDPLLASMGRLAALFGRGLRP
ncbi:TetR/AcrR family transcriptional regulator [Pararhodobacter marinus]|uniref:TetR/AcrR family transcriptional regulator n=1 Tax=Pararhodobacter marinus TaxID=2184063 RepID=UPI0035128492